MKNQLIKEDVMKNKAFHVSLEKNPLISIRVIPGHFTTCNAHINHYLDVSTLKSNALIARDVARELAIPYLSSTLVDTIVCIENTKVIGAYLAEELLQEGTSVINSGGNINVVTPMSNASDELIFYDSELEWIVNKNVLLLITTISSGSTLNRVLECIEYYGARLTGISSLFLASSGGMKHEIHTLFTSEDITGYKLFLPGECEMCKSGQPIDAIISSEGYTRIKN